MKVDYKKSCRICLKNEKFKISVFCEYSQQSNIHFRIEKYLNIKIFPHDDLPKYICYDCLANLNFVENFVETSNRNQNVLLENKKDDNIFDEECLQSPQDTNTNNNNFQRRHSLSYHINNESNSEKLFKRKDILKQRKDHIGSEFTDTIPLKKRKSNSLIDLSTLGITNYEPNKKLTINVGNKKVENVDNKKIDLQKKKTLLKLSTEKLRLLKNDD